MSIDRPIPAHPQHSPGQQQAAPCCALQSSLLGAWRSRLRGRCASPSCLRAGCSLPVPLPGLHWGRLLGARRHRRRRRSLQPVLRGLQLGLEGGGLLLLAGPGLHLIQRSGADGRE